MEKKNAAYQAKIRRLIEVAGGTRTLQHRFGYSTEWGLRKWATNGVPPKHVDAFTRLVREGGGKVTHHELCPEYFSK